MFLTCNLCNYPLVRLFPGVFGLRCIKCKSSFIHRGLGNVLNSIALNKEAKVHEFSNHGAIYKYLKRRFPNLSTSEYFDNVPSGEMVNGVLCQNVESLSFEDESFDLLTSTEIFEHVFNDLKGFREIYRCLKPGGYFVFTVPIEEAETTIERAKLENGKVIHILPPEMHGDHLRSKGILAVRNYGKDISKRLSQAGFSEVKLINVFEPKFGIKPARYVVYCKK